VSKPPRWTQLRRFFGELELARTLMFGSTRIVVGKSW